MGRYRVAMDIGGTFTDVVTYDQETGAFAATKASTTPGDLSEGVLAGLDAVVDEPAGIDFLVHGTTQGLNAFLERRGVPLLLLGTPRPLAFFGQHTHRAPATVSRAAVLANRRCIVAASGQNSRAIWYGRAPARL